MSITFTDQATRSDMADWHSASERQYLSRKHMQALMTDIASLMVGNFDERTVRSLLMNIRAPLRERLEVFVNVRQKAGLSPANPTDWDQLLDVCDLLAHPRKDRNELVNLVGESIQTYAASMITGGPIPPVKVIHADDIAATLLVACAVCLAPPILPLNTTLDVNELKQVKLDEVALCIMCALQDAVVLFKKSRDEYFHGAGRILFSAWEGTARLYCVVTGHAVDVMTGTDTKGLIHWGFPVMTSDWKVPPEMDMSPQYNGLPGIFYAARAADGTLHLRTVVEAVPAPDSIGLW